jgi:hypothetical protein
MLRLEEDNNYQKITKLLKDLPKINASANFETELTRKINLGEQKKIRESWFNRIFSPQFVPTAALAATAVIIFLLLSSDSIEAEDPFRIDPPLREETIISPSDVKLATEKGEVVGQRRKKEIEKPVETIADNEGMKNNLQTEDSILNEPIVSEQQASLGKIKVTTSAYRPSQAAVVAGGLNYKMVRSSDEELKQIEMLRQKYETKEEYLQKK